MTSSYTQKFALITPETQRNKNNLKHKFFLSCPLIFDAIMKHVLRQSSKSYFGLSTRVYLRISEEREEKKHLEFG